MTSRPRSASLRIWEKPPVAHNYVAVARGVFHARPVAKPVLGRSLNHLMSGAVAARGGCAPAAEPLAVGPGMDTLLRGTDPARATPSGTPAAHVASAHPRPLPLWCHLAADFLLVLVGVLIVLPGAERLRWPQVFCSVVVFGVGGFIGARPFLQARARTEIPPAAPPPRPMPRWKSSYHPR